MAIPTQRDPEKTRQALRYWLAGKLDGAQDLEISELSSPAATGFSNETILFDAQLGRRRRQARARSSSYA